LFKQLTSARPGTNASLGQDHAYTILLKAEQNADAVLIASEPYRADPTGLKLAPSPAFVVLYVQTCQPPWLSWPKGRFR